MPKFKHNYTIDILVTVNVQSNLPMTAKDASDYIEDMRVEVGRVAKGIHTSVHRVARAGAVKEAA